MKKRVLGVVLVSAMVAAFGMTASAEGLKIGYTCMDGTNPFFVTIEAKVKELQEKKEREELNRVIPVDGAKQDQVKQDSIDKLQFAGGSNDIDGTKQKTVKEQDAESRPALIE